MDFKELVTVAIDALLSNKMRTFLTALGIIIGTASVIAMVSIGQGSKASIESRITALGANTITVSAGSSRTGLVSSGNGSSTSLILEDYNAIKSKLDSNLTNGITPQQSTNSQLIYKDKNTNVSVTGASEDYMTILNYTLKSGSFFNSLQDNIAARVVVLGSTTASTLFPTDDPINKQIQIGNQLFTVIGVLNAKGQSGFQNQDDLAVIPIQTSKKVLVGTDVLRSIVIQAKDIPSMTIIQDNITALLIERHNIKDTSSLDFTVSNSQSTLDTLSSVTDTFTILLAGIAGISLLVGGIGIMNTMIISITERTREIGLRKAIGAKDSLILKQFIVESVVLSTLGAIFGIILGLLISFILSISGIIATSVSIESVLLSASISMLIGLIFGIYPAKKAAELNPIDALRYE